jgi:predicted TPR repeat methyltransferase
MIMMMMIKYHISHCLDRSTKRMLLLQPHASQGWLEYSKMEEECGDLEVAARILRKGLMYCEYSEVRRGNKVDGHGRS